VNILYITCVLTLSEMCGMLFDDIQSCSITIRCSVHVQDYWYCSMSDYILCFGPCICVSSLFSTLSFTVGILQIIYDYEMKWSCFAAS
jgi:hypothetical protein